MKFKVGDKVRVKSKEWYNRNQISGRIESPDCAWGFVAGMSEWCGRILTVKAVNENAYTVDENKGIWHDFMLEDGVDSYNNEPFNTAQLQDAANSLSTIKPDPVNHPDHYTSGGMQCWDAIKASMTHEAFCGYLKGNVQKYIWRYEKKVAPVEDLRKAAVYLNKLIEEVNGSN